MAYLGNKKGPKESRIIERLGRSFFGITPAQLASDIEMFEDSERRGEVQPVHVDENGRPYIVFSRPDNQTSRFYLEEHNWMLEGDILTHSKEEAELWKRRLTEK